MKDFATENILMAKQIFKQALAVYYLTYLMSFLLASKSGTNKEQTVFEETHKHIGIGWMIHFQMQQ